MERINNLSKINIGALLFVSLMNALSIFIRGADLVYILTFVLPYFVVAVIIYLCRKFQKHINIYWLVVLGIGIIFGGQAGNFSGAILFVYAIHLDPGKNKTIFKLSLMAVSIAVKTLLIEINPIQTINLLFAHFLCYAYYYVLFTERKIITIPEIEDQTEQIIDYLTEGYTIKEIAVKTCLTSAAVNKRISRLRDKENCKTTCQLIYKLSKSGQKHKQIDRFKIM